MIRIDLAPDEAMLLRETLESWLSDLRMEIAATDAMDFREELKGKEDLLKGLIERLKAQGA